MDIKLNEKVLLKYSGEFLSSGIKTIKICYKFLINSLDKDDPSYRKQVNQLEKDEENYIKDYILKYKKNKSK